MEYNQQFQDDLILLAAELYKTAFMYSDDEITGKAKDLLLKVARFELSDTKEAMDELIEEISSCELDINQGIYFLKHKITEAFKKGGYSE